MKAVYSVGQGEASSLNIRHVPVPVPGRYDILIRVCGAGLNQADILQRKGAYPPPPGVTDILGLEASGEVVAVGASLPSSLIGQKRCALLAGGGYAAYVTAPFSHTLPIPAGVSVLDAATLPEVCATLWYNLHMKARIRPNESVLIHGGSGGVGSMAIQMLSAWGVECYATAGSIKKCQWAEQLGAKKVFNYHEEDFVEGLLSHTHNRGVDVVLDMVGGDYIHKNMTVLRQGGRLVNIAFQRGGRVDASLSPLIRKNLTWMGTTLRNQPGKVKTRIIAQIYQDIWPLLESGQIKPTVDRLFMLEEAMKAHLYMEKAVHLGKILLRLE